MSLERLAVEGLPLNRKERFYTGTIFPAIVCCEDLAHLGRLLKWFDITDVDTASDPASTNLQVFTEYGFAESIGADGRFVAYDLGKDVPDIVIYIEKPRPRLIAFEAKMYDVPSATELDRQIAKQRGILQYLASILGAQIHLAALIPEALAVRLRSLAVPTLTWEEILTMYEDVAPAYWVGMLRLALGKHKQLVAKGLGFGTARYDKISGREIVDGVVNGGFPFVWMGCLGGLAAALNKVETGEWRDFLFDCRLDPVPKNESWFEVRDFVREVERARTRLATQ